MTQWIGQCSLATAALLTACLPVPATSISGAGSGIFPLVSTIAISGKDGMPPTGEVTKTLNYTVVSLDDSGLGRETARYLVTLNALRQNAAQPLPSSAIAEHYTLASGEDGACKKKSEQMLLCTLAADGRASFTVQVTTQDGWLPSGMLKAFELKSPILDAVTSPLPLQTSLILSESDAFIRSVFSPVELTAIPDLVCGEGKSITSSCGNVRRGADLNLYIGSAALGPYEDKVSGWEFELKPLSGDIKAWLSRASNCPLPEEDPEAASYTRLDFLLDAFDKAGRKLYVCGDGASGRVEVSSRVNVVVVSRPQPSNPETSEDDSYECSYDPTVCAEDDQQHGCCFPLEIHSPPDVVTFPPLAARVNQIGDLDYSDEDTRADFSLQALDCFNRPLASLPLDLHAPGLDIDTPTGQMHLTDPQGLVQVSASVEMKQDSYDLNVVVDQAFDCAFKLE